MDGTPDATWPAVVRDVQDIDLNVLAKVDEPALGDSALAHAIRRIRAIQPDDGSALPPMHDSCV